MNSKIENILGYTYKDKNLLKTALTHSSYANEHNAESYERFEFLGDALLNFIVGEYLFENFNVSAGELSKYRAKLVSTEKLSEVVSLTGLKFHLILGSSMKEASNNVLADVFESLLASIYLDSNMTEAKKFVKRLLLVNIDNVEKIINNEVDYKTHLQEFIQSLPGERLSIQFKVVKEEKINNVNQFTVELIIGGKVIATQTDLSIKKCEQKCSKIALEILKQ